MNWSGSAPVRRRRRPAAARATSNAALRTSIATPESRRRGGRRRRAARRRRRSSRWRRPPRRPARRRTAAPGGGRPRPAPAGERNPRPSTASPPAAQPWRPAMRERRRPGSAPERSTGAWVQAPITVTAITTWSRRVRSPPTTLAPTRAHSSAKPRAKSSAHWAGRSRGRGQADGERVRAAAHRVDVGEVLRRGPVADVLGRWPSRGGSAGPRRAGRWRPRRGPCADPQHRGVVAGPDQHVLALAGRARRSAAISPNSPDVGQGGVRREASWRSIPPDARAVTSRYRHGPALSAPDRLRRQVVARQAADHDTGGEPHDGRPGLHPDPDRRRQGRRGGPAIAQVKGVTLAEDVTGPYDVIVRAEARNVDELGKLVVVEGAEPRRHHPHPHLPGRPHLTS